MTEQIRKALAEAAARAEAVRAERALPDPDPTRTGWWTPFRTAGSNGRIAIQQAGAFEHCPIPANQPCDCGCPRKELTP